LSPKDVAAILQDVAATTPSPSDPMYAHFFGGLVRLPFHDAASFDPVTWPHGPTGCLNFADGGNGGLQRVVNGLEPIYQKWQKIITRPDFWILAANWAVNMTGGPQVPFKWGRVNCNGTLPPVGNLPDPESGWVNTFSVFGARMGLNAQEIVAILGAHTLGGGIIEESGYQFDWTETPASFDNLFFVDLLNAQWYRVHSNFPKSPDGPSDEWNRYPPITPPTTDFFMLNADMALVYDNIGHSNTGVCNITVVGQTQCHYNPQTIDTVKLYASDINKWHADFAQAYYKLVTTGYDEASLHPVQ
jgi:catalase (peroxidase I)